MSPPVLEPQKSQKINQIACQNEQLTALQLTPK